MHYEMKENMMLQPPKIFLFQISMFRGREPRPRIRMAAKGVRARF